MKKKPSVPDLNRYIGLPLASAIALAKSEGFAWRITAKDGVSFPVTMDFCANRLNFALKNDHVVLCTRG